MRPACSDNQRCDLTGQACDQGARDIGRRALPFVQFVGSIRLAVNRTPGRQRHAASRVGPLQFRMSNPDSSARTAEPGIRRCRPRNDYSTSCAEPAASHAVGDEASRHPEKEPGPGVAEMAQRSFDANRFRKVRKREKGNGLRTRHDGAGGVGRNGPASSGSWPRGLPRACGSRRPGHPRGGAPSLPRRRRYSSPRKPSREGVSPLVVRSIFGPPVPLSEYTRELSN